MKFITQRLALVVFTMGVNQNSPQQVSLRVSVALISSHGRWWLPCSKSL